MNLSSDCIIIRLSSNFPATLLQYDLHPIELEQQFKMLIYKLVLNLLSKMFNGKTSPTGLSVS